MLFEMLLPESKREPKTATAARSGLKPAVAATAALMLSLGLAFTAAGSPASALREYNAGKYDQSLKDYQQALQKKKDDPRLHIQRRRRGLSQPAVRGSRQTIRRSAQYA
jgi:hypothetical protein